MSEGYQVGQHPGEGENARSSSKADSNLSSRKRKGEARGSSTPTRHPMKVKSLDRELFPIWGKCAARLISALILINPRNVNSVDPESRKKTRGIESFSGSSSPERKVGKFWASRRVAGAWMGISLSYDFQLHLKSQLIRNSLELLLTFEETSAKNAKRNWIAKLLTFGRKLFADQVQRVLGNFSITHWV